MSGTTSMLEYPSTSPSPPATLSVATNITTNVATDAGTIATLDPLIFRNGLDPGDELTPKGKARRVRTKRGDICNLNDPHRYRFQASHIRRAFDLFCRIPTLINNGIKRRARESNGEIANGVMSDEDYRTFQNILGHLPGLNDDIIRYSNDVLAFRTLIRNIQDAADAARSNDVANIKKDIGLMLSDDGTPVIKAYKKSDPPSSKSDRGFHNDTTGLFLCPVIYDWNDPSIRQNLREGHYAVTADTFPRLLYEDCQCDLDDLGAGFGRNKALLKVVKYIFTGRSSAFSETAGGKTTRPGNAELAGMRKVTPHAIAYGACMLRFAFYWNIIGAFQEHDKFSTDLLAWWDFHVFGISLETTKPRVTMPVDAGRASLAAFKAQRAIKQAAAQVLQDRTNHQVQPLPNNPITTPPNIQTAVSNHPTTSSSLPQPAHGPDKSPHRLPQTSHAQFSDSFTGSHYPQDDGTSAFLLNFSKEANFGNSDQSSTILPTNTIGNNAHNSLKY